MVAKHFKPNFTHYLVYWWAWFHIYRQNKKSMAWALVQLKTLCKLRARTLSNRNIYCTKWNSEKYLLYKVETVQTSLRILWLLNKEMVLCTWIFGPHLNMHWSARGFFWCRFLQKLQLRAHTMQLEAKWINLKNFSLVITQWKLQSKTLCRLTR